MSDDDQAITESTRKTVPPGLTPWKPGQSGNPGGRPKGVSLATKIMELLTPEAAERIIQGLIERSVTDDVALKTLIERTDGKVPTRIAGLQDDDGTEKPILIIERAAPANE